jgi:heme/copper-type cytochrome/quinol oxidase subunit 2
LLEKDYLNTVKDMPEKYLVDSNMIIAKDPKFLRLLSTDQCLVIPSKTPIRILVTSNDVIHSWAVPSYGVKMDAVPGRINQQLLNIPLTGTSWGQCSELCGVNHAYMPIEVKVLSFGDFLFYMELKLKEIIFPFLLNYYKVRINLMLNFVNYLRENFDRPEV